MRETVRYTNDVNEVSFRGFSKRELNLFFTMCATLKDKGEETISMSFEQIQKLANITYQDKKEFVRLLDEVYNKMLNLKIGIQDNPLEKERFVLFTGYKIKGATEEVVEVSVNPKFKYVLNSLVEEGGFTKFALLDYTEFESTYTQECFRRLKQFRATGYWRVSIERFKALLDVPKSYKMSKIDERVLKPIIDELSNYYNFFKVDKVYSKGERGRPRVIGLEFYFDKEPIENLIEDKYDNIKQFNAPNVEHIPPQYPKPKEAKEGKKVTNIPDWVQKESKTVATAQEQKELERLRKEMQED